MCSIIAHVKVSAIKTHKITEKDNDLFAVLDTYLPQLADKTIIAITSKIVAITQGRAVKSDNSNKDELIKQEAELYLPRETNKYHIFLTVKNNLLIPSAGIDESNADGYFVLWPEHIQQTANAVREYLIKKHSFKYLGVVITDSKTTPLRWGVTGAAIAHSGFKALNNYIGDEDIFGKKLKYTKVNVMDALAASATLVMGEGKEQTPLALIEDVGFVEFQGRNPSREELEELHIAIEEDLYAPLLKNVPWEKGGKS